MKIITVSEFRKNIKKYAVLSEKERVIVNRGNGEAFIIVSLKSIDDNGYSKEFVKKILDGAESAEKGNVTRIKDVENIWGNIL